MTESLLKKYYFEKSFGLIQKDSESREIDKEQFKRLCDKRLSEYSPPEELVLRMKFINIVDRINIRHPFLSLEKFLTDYLEGEYSKDLLSKYHITDYIELKYVVEKILMLEGKRIKKDVTGVKEKNLANHEWVKIFNFIISNCKYFHDELMQLINVNILRAVILVYLFNTNQRITTEELKTNIVLIAEEVMPKINLLKEIDIRYPFLNFLQGQISTDIQEILLDLKGANIITISSNNEFIDIDPQCRNVESSITNVLTQYPEGTSYTNLYRKMEKNNALIRFTPRTGILEQTLKEMETSQVVRRISSYWRFRPYSDILILSKELESRAEREREELWSHGETAFFGRDIDSALFLEELKLMNKGDFYDKDDQVTRVAGLFLSLSSFFELRHEKLPQFDFSLKLTKDRQLISCIDNIMKKDQVFHVKVMISESVDLRILSAISEVLPKGENALIINIDSMNPNLLNKLFEHSSVAVFGENEMISIMKKCKKIPCIVNSICKIMYGDHRGKLVRLDGVDYQSRIAAVNILPNEEEMSIGIGSLEEISLGNSKRSDQQYYSENYEKFLSTLSEYCDGDALIKGTSYNKLLSAKCIVYSEDGSPNRKYDLQLNNLVSQNSNIPDLSAQSKMKWELKIGEYTCNITYDPRTDFDHSELDNANLRIRAMFQCNCMHWDGVADSFTFCPHLINSLDLMVRKTGSLGGEWFEENNIVARLLHRFITLNNSSSIEAVLSNIHHGKVPKVLSYIESLPCSDKESPYSSELRIKLRKEIIEGEQQWKSLQMLLAQIESSFFRMQKSEVEEMLSSIKSSLDQN